MSVSANLKSDFTFAGSPDILRSMTQYIPRAIEKRLKDAVSQFPVVLITGPRQAGKSTLLQHALPDYKYVTLDDPLVRALATNDPELFLSTYKSPVIIDEIQYAPNLFSYLKLHVDRNRSKYGQYVLTGSQTFQLMKGVSESLAGRIAILQLYPLSWSEIAKSPKDDQVCVEQMIQGFYPELSAGPKKDQNLWYSSYVATYLERDVRNLKAITDLNRFQTFLSLIAVRAGQLLNMSEIAKECGISEPTVKDWLTILQATYVIFLLQPYYNNVTKRLVKSPKVFFVDTGLLCYLLGIDTPDRFRKASERGHIFENMVIAECVKQAAQRTERSEFYFYRTADSVEVDLIWVRSGKPSAYEIKWSKTLDRQMAQPMVTLLKDHRMEDTKVLSLHENDVPLMDGVTGSHWSSILKGE